MGSHGALMCAAHPAVAEGGLAREPLQLLEVPPRKRLPVGPEQDPCGSRPTPEGAGAGAEQGHSAGGGSWCRHCHTKLAELKRQAWKLVSGSGTPLRDPCFSSLLLDQLPAPGSLSSCRPEGGHRCSVCAAHLYQLTREALRLLQVPAGRGDPDAHPGGPGLAPSGPGATDSPQDVPVVLGPAGGRPGRGAPDRRKVLAWPSRPSVQVSVAPAGLGGALSTVTIQAQQCLEGMWSVSGVGSLLPASCLAEAAVAAVAVADTVRDGPPAPGADGVSKMWGRGGACTTALVSPVPGTPAGGSTGASAAASFFVRAVQKLSLASKRKKPHPPPAPASRGTSTYPTDFSGALQLWPPPVPPCLLRASSKAKDNPSGVGKVKVVLRVRPAQGALCSAESPPSFLKVDPRKKQVTLYDRATGPPGSTGSRLAVTAAVPKMFAFDAVFPPDSEQAEVCSGTVADVLQSVVSGADGCIFSFGPTSLGTSHTMIGKDSSPHSFGVVPCAISWLFRLIGERRERTGTRFSVRVSAVEVCGRDQSLRDLLAEVAATSLQDAQSPGVYLREDLVCGTQLQNQSELRAPTAEKAAFYLDAALAARGSGPASCPEDARSSSHMLFTLHVYQYRVEKCGKGGMSGGRSRLHLLDLGGCEGGTTGGPLGLSLSALGSVILALLSGAKHVPHRDHRLTLLLREALAAPTCHTTMIVHVSDAPARLAETLSTAQLAARVHRLRRKKVKCASSSSGGDSSCEEGCARPAAAPPLFHPRSGAHLAPSPPRDPDYSSSSEQSCDTVVYVGPGGAALSDRELTDGEGPPDSVPIVPALSRRRPSGGLQDADHFRCGTFAELQERLDCIDGSEDPSGALASPARGSRKPSPPEAAAPRMAADIPLAVNTPHRSSSPDAHCGAPELDGGAGPELLGPDKAPGGGSRRPLPSPAPPPPGQLDSGQASTELEGRATDPAVRMPPLGMSGQGGCSRLPMRGCLERGLLTTTVTLQQPVELNGEDELVFTVVEELALGGRPASLASFSSDCSLQALASGSRPVSIISSINDEFDAYTSQAAGSSVSSGLRQVGVCATHGPELQPCPRARPDPFRPNSPAGPNPLGPRIPDSSPGHNPPDSPGPVAAAATAQVGREPQAMSACRAAPLQTIHSSLPRKSRTTLVASCPGGPHLALSPPGSGGQFEDPWLLQADGRGPRQVTSASRTPSPAPVLACAQRVVDGCEVAARVAPRPEAVAQIPVLRRGATTLGVTTGVAPCGDVPVEWEACLGSPSAASSSKRSVVPRGGLFLRPGGSAPPAPPVRKSSLEHKTSPAPTPPPAGGPAWPGAAALFPGEGEARPSGRADHSVSKATSSLKARAGKAETEYRPAAHGSLERCEGLAPSSARAREAAGRPARAVPRLGVPPSSPAPGPAPAYRGSPARAVGAPKPPAGGGKGRGPAGSGSRALGLSAKPLAPVAGRTPGGPAAAPRAAPRASPGIGAKVSRGTIMGTKQALRAAHSRVDELAAGGARGRSGPSWGSADSDSGNDSGVNLREERPPAGPLLPSPYSKVTAPRRPQRYSSGHGSDNSSVLSGELPPAMGRTALFYHSGGSSGYESMMRDSEATGSASSAPDSMSDSGAASPGSRARSLKSPKKRATGLQRRRLIPAPLPDAATLSRKPNLPGQWVDLPPPPGASLKEPFEIKVYEIDDVERLQRHRPPPRGELEGPVCASVKVRLAERQQQKLRDVWAKRELLCAELAATQGRLMLEPGRWRAQFEVDPALEPESVEHLEALERATAALERHVNLCKAHIMMVTCFDISVTTPAATPGPREVDV
ncbi:kinesin-like protein KIF26A isoform X2 [Sturnira hondurensis]|uniref:kinesin-like protein KIF26A isoform X2 n=1 Tax=Sturnira hondurensis TaxID=192404 RepID=UPI00187A0100|nr:kinesin-like protein KIF26A isoform X2 [Sturnira hondurensis]